MKTALKIILIVLLVVFIIIQFIRPVENKNEEIAQQQITAAYPVPENVMKNLKVSCYDCHSNTTVYPFYWKIQPVAWFLNDHIEEGKRHLNFSIFTTYPLWRQHENFKDIVNQLKKDEMPLESYTLIHRNAILTPQEKQDMEDWATARMKEMEAKYPADSLARPKRLHRPESD
ncbi:MAG TPA: heme-binding domain-containing protein [Hanamia sp.]|nr:heme-binding domain-containing protein [Hanamia sp.]